MQRGILEEFVKGLIVTLTLSLVFGISAFAGSVSLVTDNSELPDSASWGSLGSTSKTISVSGTVTSADGVGVTPAPPSGGGLFRYDATPSGFGNGFGFPSGDQLLYNGGSDDAKKTGDITLTFSELVSGAGLLFVDAEPGTEDTFHISAFDSGGDLLGTETVPFDGFANTSPEFIGILDTDPEIASVTIGSIEGDFAVDTLYLADSSSSSAPTPEPASLILTSLAFVSFGAFRRFRRG
jgi:hypothetical protein